MVIFNVLDGAAVRPAHSILAVRQDGLDVQVVLHVSLPAVW